MNNRAYRDIMSEYERQLALDKREQRERIQDIYIKLPDYKALDDKTVDLSAEAAIKAASGQKAEAALILKELSYISGEKKRILRDAGYADDYISLRYKCPDCKDTGYVGGRKCHCLVQKLVEYYYAKTGIYEKLKEENFDTFSFEYFTGEDLENIKKAYSDAKEFVETFAESYKNMLFYGGVGCGKTFMSNCIAKELIDRGFAVLYISAIKLFDTLSARRFSTYDIEDEEYNALFTSPLLIIDDLGTEIDSSVVNSELFNVLNERDLNSRATIISTNLELDKLTDLYSERSVSRIFGKYKVIKFTGDDLRIKRRRNG